MNIDLAIQKHVEWKVKFHKAISSRGTIDSTEISRDDCCELGKWLHGEAREKFDSLKSYAACVARHAEFHAEAARIAEAINNKQYQEAKSMLDAGTPYANACSSVGVAIGQFKREAGGRLSMTESR